MLIQISNEYMARLQKIIIDWLLEKYQPLINQLPAFRLEFSWEKKERELNLNYVPHELTKLDAYNLRQIMVAFVYKNFKEYY